jgi:hypothetical protein
MEFLSKEHNIESKFSFEVIEWSKEFDFLSDEYAILIELVSKELKKEITEENKNGILDEIIKEYKIIAKDEVKKMCDEYDESVKS